MVNRRRRESFYDPRNGDPALRVQGLSWNEGVVEPPRTNYFAVYWIAEGAGEFWADTAQRPFGPASLLFFVPYQYLRFALSRPVRGELVQFHANFLCVETFHAEVGCSGALFNDPYGAPLVALDQSASDEVAALLARLHREQADRDLAYNEAMLSYVKVLLIQATRWKSPAPAACAPGGADAQRHPVLAPLSELIEAHYCALHAPSDYARLLHMTPKTLGRIVKEHLGKTLTDLIRDRVLTHAKWELLHTLRPVKEIAREVGFNDELYFSRLFKKATGVSPKFFREFETEIRGGSNLSMFSDHAPIPPRRGAADNSDIVMKERRKGRRSATK